MVRTFDTERAEAEHLADLLRRAHLEDGIAWDEMAVLVRSGRTSIPPLRRALGAAGVPVEVASDEVPLVRDPAVLPLLDALRAVVNLDNDDPDHVDYLDPGRAEALLLGPLGGLDAGDVRRLARQLRTREKDREPGRGAARRAPSRELVRRGGGRRRASSTGSRARRSSARAALAALLAGAARRARRRRLGRGGALDAVVAAPPGRTRLRRVGRRSAAARPAGPTATSTRSARSSRSPPGPRSSATTSACAPSSRRWSPQQIPADTLAERGARGAAVRLLTAHRAKGLEWRLVVVAHVQQEGWPDLRRRSTLLQADRIGTDGAGAAGDRRASCCSRSAGSSTSPAPAPASGWSSPRSRRPTTTASSRPASSTSSASSDRARRSAGRRGRCRWPAWSPSCAAPSPTRRPAEPLRDAAARRLARLAARAVGSRRAGAGGRPGDLVGHPRGDPVRPAGPRPRPAGAGLGQRARGAARSARPSGSSSARPAASPAPTSPPTSASCARARRAGRHTASCRRPDDVDVLMEHVDAGLGPARLPHALVEGARARAGPRRPGPVPALAPRQPARGCSAPRRGSRPWSSSTTASRSQLTGYADRLELDADGQVVVVDLKTGRAKPPTRSEVERPPPARRSTSTPSTTAPSTTLRPGDAAAAGGAELVQLGLRGRRRRRGVQAQEPQADDGAERDELARASSAAPRRCCAPRSFPAVAGAALPRLLVRADLPDQERRVGDRPVTRRRSGIDTAERPAAG